MNPRSTLLVSCLLTAALLPGCCNKKGCGNDGDCPGDMICVSSACIDPDSAKERKSNSANRAESEAPFPFRGGANAKVVMDVYGDFECPYSKKMGERMNELSGKYGNQLKIQWHNRPIGGLHPNANLAAEAATEVFKQKGSDAFWKYHDKLFENQKAPGGLERAALERYAAELGCSMDQFRSALDTRKHQAAVEAEGTTAIAAGINGTPTSVINGTVINGPRGIEEFARPIDAALAGGR